MKTLINAIAHPKAVIQGAVEFRLSCGLTFDDDRDDAYDFGRDLAHRLTFRRWDYCK